MCRPVRTGKEIAAGGAGGQQAEAQPGGGERDELGGQQRGAAGRDQRCLGDGLVPELAGDGQRVGDEREGLRQRERGAGRADARRVAGQRGRRRRPDDDQGERADGE
jgi:hypothetical protein